jgi:hypothetical protein
MNGVHLNGIKEKMLSIEPVCSHQPRRWVETPDFQFLPRRTPAVLGPAFVTSILPQAARIAARLGISANNRC